MATFGPIASANSNVLFDPAAAMGAAQAYKRNDLLMQNAQQDQQAENFQRDANARIALARQMADLPDDVLAQEWGPAVQRMNQAGLGHGLDPSKPPPRERLKQIAASDLTTFQRLQLDEKRRASEAMMALVGGGAPAAGGMPAAGGGGAPATAPADLMPHFQAASAATGVPVPLLVAQAKQESGFNPNATGGAGEVGIMQIKPSTAQQPGFGVQPADPASLRDPGKNIMFGAQYLAARSPGADWNNPAQRDGALTRYNGGGDPNYAANVTRNLPQVGPNGLTAVQQREVAAMALTNPSAVPAAMAQARRENEARQQQAVAEERQMRGEARADQRFQAQEQRAAATDARMTAAQERQAEAARQAAERAGVPAGYRKAADGSLEFIPGGPADPALKAKDASGSTESERKAAAFLHRMQGAENEMRVMTENGYDPSNLRDKAADRTPLVGNYLQSKEGQQYFTAATEWARAKLRAESGAVISDSEAQNEARGYFAMPGDSAERIAQKARLRATAMEGMQTMAGRSTAEPPAPPPAAMSGADALKAARAKLGAGASDDDLVAEAIRLRGGH